MFVNTNTPLQLDKNKQNLNLNLLTSKYFNNINQNDKRLFRKKKLSIYATQQFNI